MRSFKCEYKTILLDGLHLNDLGNEVLYKLVLNDLGDIPFWRDHWSVWKMAEWYKIIIFDYFRYYIEDQLFISMTEPLRMNIAVAGRMNAGKSTFTNALT